MGQNFMVEPSLFPILSDYASLSDKDVTLDIGAGLGFLTCFLANKCKNVLAVEVDDLLVGLLCEQLESLTNVEIIRGSVLKVRVPRFNKVVAIPPYQISSRLLVWLFKKGFDCAVLVFQKEFANRLVASVGGDDYGWLTVLTYFCAGCELLDGVPKSLFYPQPEVDSIIIRLSPRQPLPFALKDELFMKMVRSLFTQRNRKTRNAVLPFLKGILGKTAEDAANLVDELPFQDKRVRELAPEDFGELANALFG
jgi:16S rRNA (adenine1518-N6/adenine1519-N6)-dimethyltransferase